MSASLINGILIFCAVTIAMHVESYFVEKRIKHCIDNSLTIDAAYKCVGEE